MTAERCRALSAARKEGQTHSAVAQALTRRLETIAEDLQQDIVSLRTVGQQDPYSIDLARMARRYLRARRYRAAALGAELFADPCWDMMLDLFASRVEGARVSVTSACVAANVPSTTALRYMARLEQLGLLVRTADPLDGRRFYVSLSDLAHEVIAGWIETTFPRRHADPDD